MQYARTEGHLPKDLSLLPPMPDFDTKTTDSWGRPLLYNVDADGNVVLKSYGRDGQPGGEGLDRDMIGIFAPKDSDGKWSDEVGNWIHDPRR